MGFTANLRTEHRLRYRKPNITVAAVWSITKHKAKDPTLGCELLLINVLFPLLILPMVMNDS